MRHTEGTFWKEQRHFERGHLSCQNTEGCVAENAADCDEIQH